MFILLARLAGFVITAATGWAAADIYNEHKELKQAQAGASLSHACKNAYTKNKGKWVFLTVATVIGFFVIMFVVKPFLGRGKQQQSIL